jgi:hypothetical protein
LYYTLAQELQGTRPDLVARAQALAQAILKNTTANFAPLPERPSN